MSHTVFVTGVAGTTGRELVRLLAAADVDVRAGVHTPSKADFPESVDVRGIDFEDSESLRDAFDGVSKLYLLTPFVPHDTELVRAAVDAAVESGSTTSSVTRRSVPPRPSSSRRSGIARARS
ncbi:hypothetical protein C2R22_19735 [Salinigranum rubrum]|uniref:NAD(P)-binding domain-containing protein n=1 Tax=Salinigranum rubrum TaxID=755307 RepID=A0A2I8VNT8_9EURY|nr:NAD(P)H-binding protein [Salinigranum rubrum]AUV83597.1 hypothetical protein C2R22_19735 [Salinigranum rubrum]